MKTTEKYLLYSSNLWNLGEGLFGPFLAVFAAQVGGGILFTSIAYSTYLFVTGFLTIYIGSVSDRYSKELLCLCGYIFNTIATFAQLLVFDIYSLLCVQVLFGIGLALSNSTWKALFEANNTKGKEGRNWGLASGEVSIMLGIATLAGGAILTYSSFSVLFVCMGVIQLAATCYQYKVYTSAPRRA